MLCQNSDGPWFSHHPFPMDVISSQCLTSLELREGSRFSDVFFGSFVTFWMNRHYDIGVHLELQPLLGMFSKSSPFVDSVSHCGSVESQNLRNSFVTLPFPI